MTDDPTKIDIEFDPTKQRMVGTAVHGNTPFDVPYISKIAHNLYQGGCRNGLVLPDYIDYVVSLYPWEQYEIRNNAQYFPITMYDSTEQTFERLDDIASFVNALTRQGKVLVHCQAGLNRSSLVVARALMLRGMPADEAIQYVRDARSPACLCNPAFEAHLRSL